MEEEEKVDLWSTPSAKNSINFISSKSLTTTLNRDSQISKTVGVFYEAINPRSKHPTGKSCKNVDLYSNYLYQQAFLITCIAMMLLDSLMLVYYFCIAFTGLTVEWFLPKISYYVFKLIMYTGTNIALFSLLSIFPHKYFPLPYISPSKQLSVTHSFSPTPHPA